MKEVPRSLDEAGLTRISVRSSRDCFLVRCGGPTVKVHKKRGRLECECGQQDCLHVMSLRLCGFVDPGDDLSLAA